MAEGKNVEALARRVQPTSIVLTAFLLLTAGSLQIGHVAASDGDTLLAVKTYFSNKAAYPLSTWKAGTDYCKWKGVTCDASKNVIDLTLSGYPVGGTIAPALGNLTSLENLSLSKCKLTGMIPDTLVQLVTLDLSYNSLVGTFPAVLGTYPERLQKLTLNNNFLVGGVDMLSMKGVDMYLANNYLTGPISLLWFVYSDIGGVVDYSGNCVFSPRSIYNCLWDEYPSYCDYYDPDQPQKSLSVCKSFCDVTQAGGICSGAGTCDLKTKTCKCNSGYAASANKKACIPWTPGGSHGLPKRSPPPLAKTPPPAPPRK